MLSTLIGMNILSKTLNVFDAWAHESQCQLKSCQISVQLMSQHCITLAGRQTYTPSLSNLEVARPQACLTCRFAFRRSGSVQFRTSLYTYVFMPLNNLTQKNELKKWHLGYLGPAVLRSCFSLSGPGFSRHFLYRICIDAMMLDHPWPEMQRGGYLSLYRESTTVHWVAR